jgi:hypothetical protein
MWLAICLMNWALELACIARSLIGDTKYDVADQYCIPAIPNLHKFHIPQKINHIPY